MQPWLPRNAHSQQLSAAVSSGSSSISVSISSFSAVRRRSDILDHGARLLGQISLAIVVEVFGCDSRVKTAPPFVLIAHIVSKSAHTADSTHCDRCFRPVDTKASCDLLYKRSNVQYAQHYADNDADLSFCLRAMCQRLRCKLSDRISC